MSDDLQLNSIGQIHITVSDVSRSVAFYRDVLGMSLLLEVPGRPMAFFDCGGIRLYLGTPEKPGFRSSPVIYYRVDDIGLACGVLQSRGVAMEDPAHVVHKTETEELWMAGFRDPDDHYLCVMSERHLTDA